MHSEVTHPSLLSRLRDLNDAAAWREFDVRYGDLILLYCRRLGLSYTDAEDVRQIVMMAMARTLPGFHYSPQRGRFRAYLGQTVRHAAFQYRARPNSAPRTLSMDMPLPSATSDHAPSAAVMAPAPDDSDALWEREWQNHHYRRAMRALRAEFDPRSLAIFDRLLGGASIAQAAGEFSTTEAAVHKVKQRVRDRLKQAIAQQVQDEQDPHELAP